MALLKRLAALLTLLALVVGAPIALWVFGRGLVPDHVSLSGAWNALTSQDDGTVWISAVLLVGAIAWALFTLCVLLEFLARVGSRKALRIPGLRVPQSAASSLVSLLIAGTVMVGGAAAASAQTLPALPHASVTASAAAEAHAASQTAWPNSTAHSGADLRTKVKPAPAAAQIGQPAVKGTSWVVKRGDTLWSVAQTTLGDPHRFPEIVTLNKGVVQPDGGQLTSADTWLEAGWRLRLPADARIPTSAATTAPAAPSGSAKVVPAHNVTVRAGESLSKIAEEQLGDGDLYPALAKANHLTDPDQIDVGQTIAIPRHIIPGSASPEPTTHPALTSPHTTHLSTPAHMTPAPSHSTAPTRTVAPATQPTAADAASKKTAAAPSTVPTPGSAATQPAQAAVAVTAAATTPATTQTPAHTAPAASDHASAAPTPQHQSSTLDVMLAGLSLLAAAATWAALRTVRRRANRRRSPGRKVAPVNLGAARAEKVLREHSDSLDPNWLDVALRTLGVALASDRGAATPDIVAAYLDQDHLRLRLSRPVPAVLPFYLEDNCWVLPVGSELPVNPLDQMAPLPTLASVAVRGDDTVLLDLERAGALSLQGDPMGCREFLNHLTVELAHNSWSDGLSVSLVGWGANLLPLNPERLSHIPTVAAATRQLRSRVAETQETKTALNTDVLPARILDIAGDAWMPEVLLIDATDAPTQDVEQLQLVLQELTASGRTTTAVVLSGTDTRSGVDEIILDSEGHVRIPHLWGPDVLIATKLSDSDIAELVELFASAAIADEPVVVEEHQVPPVIEVEARYSVPTPTPAPIEAGRTDIEIPAEANVVQIRQVSSAAAAKLASVLAGDAKLDADVAEWRSRPVSGRPQISVIGPVTVHASGVIPPNRLPRLTAVITYLALHPAGVTTDKFVTDLWAANNQPKPGTRRELIHNAREWMGRDPETNEPYLPNANDGLYRLSDRLVDSELVARLQKRARAKAAAADPVSALEDYVTALGIAEAAVRVSAGDQPQGPWLRDAAGASYSWLANPDRMDDERIPAEIVDMAHEAATLALSIHDLDMARFAGDVGHLVDPLVDIPLCDLLLVAKSAGNTEIAKQVARDILRVNVVEEPIECPPRTYEILHKAFPFGLEVATN